MKHDPALSKILLPSLVQRLQDQSLHLERAKNALNAVADLARSVHCSNGAAQFTPVGDLCAEHLAGLAATFGRMIELPLREIDDAIGELERCARNPTGAP